MARAEVLIEVEVELESALSRFSAASMSLDEGQRQVADVLPSIEGITYRPTAKPVPMFAAAAGGGESWQLSALSEFASSDTNEDLPSATEVVPCQAEESAIAELQRQGIRVWPNSPVRLIHVDCSPFRAAVPMDVVQAKLGVDKVWSAGARGGGVIVGLLDEGIDSTEYPVAGGWARSGAQQPGGGAITSHGSMCAADVLVAAPDAQLYDYPFLVRRSGGALAMMNAALEQRRVDGTPHVLSNSWGFYSIPPQQLQPEHEVWDLDHPLHRKIREVTTSGAVVLFAAGNCGEPCAARDCDASSIGAGKSIHGSNSLAEVITVGAVNSQDERIGYSSQGPGMFEPEKPDIAAYSHFFGNFGVGRPGGNQEAAYDNGTSAACPVAAGVVALLMSAKPGLSPAQVRNALIAGAQGNGAWNADFGNGIVNAGASLASLQESKVA